MQLRISQQRGVNKDSPHISDLFHLGLNHFPWVTQVKKTTKIKLEKPLKIERKHYLKWRGCGSDRVNIESHYTYSVIILWRQSYEREKGQYSLVFHEDK